MNLPDLLVTLGAISAGVVFYIVASKLRAVPLRTWWRPGAGVLNVFKHVGYGVVGVWWILVMAWGIGILLWFGALVALGVWILQHWWIGIPAVMGLFLVGRTILKWAAKVRCDICKHSVGEDPATWTIVNLRTKKPNESLLFVHRDCMTEEAQR
ncbi:hypothetical protein AB0F43_31020 [Kribbella sp. NPDC023972]|uniref:hypothetical protein n=1 Tax=Kribbella sp. NPDC023972 TaxID=3154795 RepID=UPI0033C5A15E